jgi:hypothetical protein
MLLPGKASRECPVLRLRDAWRAYRRGLVGLAHR